MAEVVRFQIPIPENETVEGLALSPDGRRLALGTRTGDRRTRVWVRSLDTLEAHALPGAPPGAFFWSADSRFIGFVSGKTLKKVDATSGSAEEISDVGQIAVGGAWAPDGTILFGSRSQMMRVPETGGVPVAVTSFPRDSQGGVANPSFLPDGRHFVYIRAFAGQSAIYLGSLDL